MKKLSRKPSKQRKYRANLKYHEVSSKLFTVRLDDTLKEEWGIKRLPIRLEDEARIVRGEFEKKAISPYKHLEFVEELFKKEKLLNLTYNSVSVTHSNNLVTQVPLPFFDKNNKERYLQYSIKVLENDYITFDEIKNSEIVNVYIPFVNINNFLIDKFNSFIYKHSSTVLI